MITRKQLEDRRAVLVQDHKTLLANAHAIDGAIQVVDQILVEFDAGEVVAENTDKNATLEGR